MKDKKEKENIKKKLTLRTSSSINYVIRYNSRNTMMIMEREIYKLRQKIYFLRVQSDRQFIELSHYVFISKTKELFF